MKYGIGIDIGGSHVSGGIVDLMAGKLLKDSYREYPINPLAPSDEILDNWMTLILNIIGNNTLISKIGFAMPGPFDYERGIALFKGVPKYTHLYGLPVRTILTNRLVQETGRNFELQFINDATAFALGEYAFGAAQEMSKCWILTLGTGLGSTFLQNGTPQLTGRRMPKGGYLYNQPYKDGIADEYFSTRWFVKQYPGIASVKELVILAIKGDKKALDLFCLFAQNLAAFLSPWLKKTQAEGIIIGGGIAHAWEYFHPTLVSEIQKADINIIIKRATLGGTAPILGALT